MSGLSLFDKVWAQHVVQAWDDGWALLHIDRHLLHDISGAAALGGLKDRGLSVRNPGLAAATPDHMVSTAPGRTGDTSASGASRYHALRDLTAQAGMRMFDLGQPGQGIVHVIGAELGLVQPGMTVVCGDSHTCTNGALGALAFGIGTSEVGHVLATQTVMQRKPAVMRILLTGSRRPGVTAKDIALAVVGRAGTSGATGCAIEFAGEAVRAMEMEERMTLCNLSIEMGAKVGMVAPDEKTFEYLRGRAFAPKPELFERAVASWRLLKSDDDARFDREVAVDVAAIGPMITWGTSPEQVVTIGSRVPSPTECEDPAKRTAWQGALDYMGLQAGQELAGTRVDRVFIGSCTNSRLSDLREAAASIRGRRVSPGVKAWVVPGSENVRRAAEEEGIADTFRAAGFDWREPGCSMCVGVNGDTGSPGERIVSTSNRNFVGRQGPGVRTHLASPVTAVASAIAGVIAAGDMAPTLGTSCTSLPGGVQPVWGGPALD